MKTPIRKRTMLVFTLFLGGALTVASADQTPVEVSGVDFEKLKAALHFDGGRAVLEVEYDIEFEDILPAPGETSLVLTLAGGEGLVQPSTPVEFVIPLTTPSEVDDDEVEFESTVWLTLSQPPAFGELTLVGSVIENATGALLAQRTDEFEIEVEYLPRPYVLPGSTREYGRYESGEAPLDEEFGYLPYSGLQRYSGYERPAPHGGHFGLAIGRDFGLDLHWRDRTPLECDPYMRGAGLVPRVLLQHEAVVREAERLLGAH